MSKTIKQLQQEYSANEVKIQQEKHKLQRLNNRVQYYEKGGRQKRAHRLMKATFAPSWRSKCDLKAGS